MKNLAIVLATLCIFAQATSMFQNPAFLEIKAEPFGNSVATLIEINMSSQDPSGRLDAIWEVLNTVEASLKETEAHNEAEIQRERGWCSDAEETLKQQIASAQSSLSAYEAEQSTLTTEQSDTNTLLVKERQTLSENTANHESSVTALREENERYEHAAKDYAEAIAACEQAIQLLNTLRANPAGFVQSKARFTNVVSLLERHLANKTSTFVQPVLSVLSELAAATSELDQAKLNKVISLIEQLLQELRNQQSQNEQRHRETVENLTNAITQLEQLINNSNDLISRYEARLSEIEERLRQLVGLIETTNQLLEVLRRQLQDTNDTCAGYEKSYGQYKSELDQQLATLERLKEYFKSTVVPAVENVRDSAYEDSLSS